MVNYKSVILVGLMGIALGACKPVETTTISGSQAGASQSGTSQSSASQAGVFQSQKDSLDKVKAIEAQVKQHAADKEKALEDAGK